MPSHIMVNGIRHEVTNAYSSGPGNPHHTYDLRGVGYVYENAGVWKLQIRGQFPVTVTVTVPE